MAKGQDSKGTGRNPERKPNKPSSGNPSGVSKPKANRGDGKSKKSKTELNAQRTEIAKNQAIQQGSLEELRKRITETESKIGSAGPAESRALTTSLKELQMTEADVKKKLDQISLDMMEIDQDIMDIDEEEPRTGQALDGHDLEGESAHQSDRHPSLEVTDHQNSPLPKEHGTAHRIKTESDEGVLSQDIPKAEEDDNSPGVDKPYEEVSDLADFNKSIQYEDEAFAGIEFLEGGTTLSEANSFSGKLHLNSYGPKNSAMLTWSSSAGDKRGPNVKNIRADPHKQAMETDDDGKYKHKGKIGSIKAIAWRPRGSIGSMRDLLASVRELDPANKNNPKYVYPFCTVLVDWIGPNTPPPCLINRSNYKDLSTSGKDSGKRVDWKFYRIACIQVARFEKWAGNERLGKEISPTPLFETPEPEKQRYGSEAAITNSLRNMNGGINLSTNGQNTNGQDTNGQDTNGQDTNGQDTNGQDTNGQDTNGQDINGQNTTGQSTDGQNTNSQNANGQNTNGQNNNGQNIGQNINGQNISQNINGQNTNDLSMGASNGTHQSQPSPKLSTFYNKWLKRQPIEPTEFDKLDDIYIGKFEAAAFVYVANLKKEGFVVEDDIGADI